MVLIERRFSGGSRWMRMICFVCAMGAWGCGNEAAKEEPVGKEPLGQWFQRTQENTTVAHGRILPETVRQEGSAVVFQTSQGTTLRQEYRRHGAKGYERVGDPEIVAPATEGPANGM